MSACDTSSAFAVSNTPAPTHPALDSGLMARTSLAGTVAYPMASFGPLGGGLTFAAATLASVNRRIASCEACAIRWQEAPRPEASLKKFGFIVPVTRSKCDGSTTCRHRISASRTGPGEWTETDSSCHALCLSLGTSCNSLQSLSVPACNVKNSWPSIPLKTQR